MNAERVDDPGRSAVGYGGGGAGGGDEDDDETDGPREVGDDVC